MRVMVVTHDQRRRREVGDFLRQRGYEVQVPPSRHEVVPQARATQPEILVLDMYVSNPNGLELLRQLRAVGYAGRIVALAGKSLRNVQSDALSLGIHRVIGGLHAGEGHCDPAQVESAVRACARMDDTPGRPRISAG